MNILRLVVLLLPTEFSHGLFEHKVFTKYGPVIGLTQFSRGGREYTSFRGIPYARPPLGHLRFKAPEPPATWKSPISAIKDAPFCIQKDFYYNSNPKVEGSEDCLYMNIYVPKSDSNELLPVMVYIHGGGFIAGAGSSDIIGPEYIMDRNVIMVTFHYRVGFFGFFSTLDDAAPGNFALKDQTMALQFVQDNIEYFSGDKNRVTIFGQSAGGTSVNYHLISPLSRGLFHRAISQSGVALDIFAKPLPYIHKLFGPLVAMFTGCGHYLSNSWRLVDCLRKVNATDLTEIIQKFKYFADEPIAPHFIVIEKKTAANAKPFFTKDPLEYLQTKNFLTIPWMVGVTEDEGIFRAGRFLRRPDLLKDLNSDFNILLPLMLGLPLSNGNAMETLFRNIVNFYLGGNYFIDINNPKSIQGFIDLYSDRTINYGTYQNIILQSKKGHKDIWVYNFNYRGEYTYGDRFAATTNDINFKWGVCHNDELIYLFRIPARFPDLKDVTDLKMSDELVKIWTDFATFGDPDPLRVIGWKSLNFKNANDVRNLNLNVLHIVGSHQNNSINYSVQHGFYPERMKFWTRQRLFENLHFPGVD